MTVKSDKKKLDSDEAILDVLVKSIDLELKQLDSINAEIRQIEQELKK